LILIYEGTLMPRSRKTRTNLTASTNHRLNSYALAAGAAGVSLVALAQPSEAEIVYTPAHGVASRHASYALDLNNDGVVDFTIADIVKHFDASSLQSLAATPAVKGDGVMYLRNAFSIAYANALVQGDEIGIGFSFLSRQTPMAIADLVSSGGGQYSYFSLPFANVSDRYLGLRLQLSDGIHFGWARLNVRFYAGNFNTRTWVARITGYAYETIPGKQIKAGQITDDDASALGSDGGVQSAALGALALGSNGIALWRKSESSELLQK
jgi:hypothetical protein